MSAIRAMPVFDFPTRALRLSSPAWTRLFGKVARRTTIRRTVRLRLEKSLASTLSIYGRVLQDWCASVLNQMEKRFSSFADSYRALAERAQAGGTLGTTEENALLNDLRGIGIAQTETGIPVSTAARD